ncbi:hypothetical protein EJB05_21878, partial [Eragrostis curvula]
MSRVVGAHAGHAWRRSRSSTPVASPRCVPYVRSTRGSNGTGVRGRSNHPAVESTASRCCGAGVLASLEARCTWCRLAPSRHTVSRAVGRLVAYAQNCVNSSAPHDTCSHGKGTKPDSFIKARFNIIVSATVQARASCSDNVRLLGYYRCNISDTLKSKTVVFTEQWSAYRGHRKRIVRIYTNWISIPVIKQDKCRTHMYTSVMDSLCLYKPLDSQTPEAPHGKSSARLAMATANTIVVLAALVLLLQASSCAVARRHHHPDPHPGGGGGGTPAVMTVNGFEKGEDGGGPSECDGQYHSDKLHLVALSTRWYANGHRCHKKIRITSVKNGRSVEATVVDECDSRHGCKDNIVDTSQAVWDALGLDSNIGEVPVTWSDA